jgi:hypothetical protein
LPVLRSSAEETEEYIELLSVEFNVLLSTSDVTVDCEALSSVFTVLLYSEYVESIVVWMDNGLSGLDGRPAGWLSNWKVSSAL